MPRKPIQQSDSTEKHWATVSNGISDILACKQSDLLLSTLHTSVSALVSSSQSKVLSEGLSKLLVTHFTQWKTQLSQISGNPLVNLFSNLYNDFRNYCLVIPKVYMLYDKQETNDRSLNIIRSNFCQIILTDRTLLSYTTQSIRKDIASARSGLEIDLQKISNLIDAYYSFKNEIKLFDEFFEVLQQDTDKHYFAFYKNKFNGNTFQTYLQTIEEQFKKEENILKVIFDKKDKEIYQILGICLQRLLVLNEDDFLLGDEPPISTSLVSNNITPMKWLVETYERFDVSLENVYKSCAKFICNEMLKLTSNFTNDMKSSEITRNVSELIELTNSLSNSYEIIFNNNNDAHFVVEEEIKKAWNDKRFNIVENFCIYIDTHIRNEFKNLSADEKEKFPKVVALFYSRLIDKRLFQEIYNSNLVMRFIKMKEKVADIEPPIIQAIRREKSPDFCKGFRDYIKVIQNSSSLNERFQDKCIQLSKIKFSPIIFERRGFPLDTTETNDMSSKLSIINNAFKEFYSSEKTNSELHLLANVSTVDGQLVIPKNPRSKLQRIYTVTSDIFCASIIDAVSGGPKTFKDLKDILNNKVLVGLYLKRLCSASCPILKRIAIKQDDKKINDYDKFQINPLFVYGSSHITIQSIIDEHKKNMAKVQQKVEIDKELSIKAAIVRFLKKERKIEQSELERLIITDLSKFFRPELTTIRNILNILEEDEYFKRKTEKDGKVILEYLDAGLF
ncbi:Cullin-domain-containing protein [Histomonas meleagridis]|uniref:Cullin-domain-containing protein n=1 Tax=Histomonas meleagridis TaxID=135588 RepID=UPI003559CE8F|nr:Cullin-domain-containing protein [Histomonas meleagridis]KAH0797886.1 Cullin-domain-containing protein [Histomonas meleagridis]